MRLTPAPTKSDGNCAFHATFGTWNGREYVYDNILQLRQEIGDKIRAITVQSHNLFPSISEAIKELIRGNNQQVKLDAKTFPTLTQRRQTYDTNNEGFEDLKDFDAEVNGPIVKEYAKFIETPGIWLLPCELSVIAHALNTTIHHYGKGKNGEVSYVDTYNPGPHTQPVANVYFNGINHYEAMEVEERIFTASPGDISTPSTHSQLQTEGLYPASGIKNALHGTIFQLKLTNWVLLRAYQLKLAARISGEDDRAGKWDDIVVQMPNPHSDQAKLAKPFLYRFFQAKHKQNDEVISYGDLITSKIGDFSLTKYFRSFRKIKNSPDFQNGVLGTFCLCTNIGFDFYPKNTRGHNLSLHDALEEITEFDELLNFPNKGKHYRFKTDFQGKIELYTRLKENGDEMVILAKTLHALMQKPTGKIDKRKPPFNDKETYQWLIEQKIIDDDTKQVTPDFAVGQNLPQDAIDFKVLYDQGLNAKGVKLTDKDIDEFFSHLVFVVELPNEVELGNHLTQKIGTEFNLLDAKFLSATLLEELLDWMKQKAGTFLTTQALGDFFEEMRHQLSRLAMIGPTILYQRKLEAPGIRFTPSKPIQTFLKSDKKAIIYQAAGDLFLGGMCIYQTLQKLSQYSTHDGYIFITLKNAVLMEDVFLSIKAFKKSKLLVLSCNIAIEGKAKTLIENLFNTESLEKIIFITTESELLQSLPIFETLQTIKAQNSFAALMSESQDKLKRSLINFQGRTLTLADLPDAMDIINEAVLIELLNKNISISRPLVNATDSLYLPRTFRYTTLITKLALSKNSSDIFAIANISESTLKTLAGENTPLQFFNEVSFEENTSSQQELVRHIILDTDKSIASNQFAQLSILYPTHTLHHLTYENKRLLWQKTQGSLSGLRIYLTPEKEVGQLENPITILSAEPGMGKSVSLSHFAAEQKKHFPDSWVQFTNLLEQEELLKKLEFHDIPDAVAFFTQSTSAFTQQLFAHRLTNSGKLIIVLDGFDELQAAQQTKIIQLLQLLKNTKVQKVIISTRQHLQDTLEDVLGTFAHGLTPFTDQDALNYLQQFWLSKYKDTEIDLTAASSKTLQYATAVMKAFSTSVKEAQQFIGIPLQVKLIGEAFAEEVSVFCQKQDQQTPKIDGLSLYTLYLRFIQAKYQIFFKEKSNLAENNRFPAVQQYLTNGLDKDHQYYAFTLLFPDTHLPTELLTGAQDAIQTAGIIESFTDTPHFIHRTFAEYFAAQFFIQQLTKPPTDTQHQHYKAFLIDEIFKSRHVIIKAFITSFVEHTQEATLTKVWQEICQSHFLPKPIRHFAFNAEIEATQKFNNPVEKPILTFSELKTQVLKACKRVNKAEIYEIADATDLYCQKLLEESNFQIISDGLTTLYKVMVNTRLHKVETRIQDNLISVIHHYFSICYQQQCVFDHDTILRFITYLSKTNEHLSKEIQDILDAQPYLDLNQALPEDFINAPLSLKIFIFVLFIRQTPFTQRINEKLINTATYKELETNKTYYALLIRLAKEYPSEIKNFLIVQRNYELLHQLSIEQPENTITVAEIDKIFESQQEAFFWLERTGIDLVNTYHLLTPKMVKVFSNILAQGTNGYYTEYAHKIWHQLLIPLINHFDIKLSKSGIQRHALIEMCAHFMAFSLKHSTHWNFSPTQKGLNNLLALTEQMLESNFLDAQQLENGINLLYFLTQYGLTFIATDTALLMLDPNGEFEHRLALKQHAAIKDLLAFKATHPDKKEELQKKCRNTILESRALTLPSRKRVNPLSLSTLLVESPPAKARKQETQNRHSELMDVDP